jgi:fructose-bisphosphate aldolase, class I
MPLIVWACPRGAAVEGKGGKDSFYAVDYAARTASELGADVVKVNFPHPDKRAAVAVAPHAEGRSGVDDAAGDPFARLAIDRL